MSRKAPPSPRRWAPAVMVVDDGSPWSADDRWPRCRCGVVPNESRANGRAEHGLCRSVKSASVDPTI